MKQRTTKRTRGIKLLMTVVAAMLLAIVPMAIPAFAVGNPPSVECGPDVPFNKFQINNGDVQGSPEVSEPPGQIIDLTSNGDGTFDYELTDDDYVIFRIVMKHGQTDDIVLTDPASTGTLEPASDISHITFCFAAADIEEPEPDIEELRVNVVVGPCTALTETTPVVVTVPDGATLTIKQGDTVIETVTEDDILSLPAGDYSWTAEADDGFEIVGDDEGTFTVEDCEDDVLVSNATAEVDLGVCDFDEESLSPLTVDISPADGATVVVTDEEGDSIDFEGDGGSADLLPGEYTYEVEAAEGFKLVGDSDGTLNAKDCETEVAGTIETRDESAPEVLARTGSLGLGILTAVGALILALGVALLWLSLNSTRVELAGAAMSPAIRRWNIAPLVIWPERPVMAAKRRRRWRT